MSQEELVAQNLFAGKFLERPAAVVVAGHHPGPIDHFGGHIHGGVGRGRAGAFLGAEQVHQARIVGEPDVHPGTQWNCVQRSEPARLHRPLASTARTRLFRTRSRHRPRPITLNTRRTPRPCPLTTTRGQPRIFLGKHNRGNPQREHQARGQDRRKPGQNSWLTHGSESCNSFGPVTEEAWFEYRLEGSSRTLDAELARPIP